METCENCGTTIGALETPYLFQEHVVCQSCHARLSQAPPAAPAHVPAPSPPKERILFDEGGVRVTGTAILDGWHQFPLSQVLSVLTQKGFLPGHVIVQVFDLSRAPRKYRFASRESATYFISAIREGNPSVAVEKEDDGLWVGVSW